MFGSAVLPSGPGTFPNTTHPVVPHHSLPSHSTLPIPSPLIICQYTSSSLLTPTHSHFSRSLAYIMHSPLNPPPWLPIYLTNLSHPSPVTTSQLSLPPSSPFHPSSPLHLPHHLSLNISIPRFVVRLSLMKYRVVVVAGRMGKESRGGTDISKV